VPETDADALLDSLEAEYGDSVRMLVEYTESEYEVLYISESAEEAYPEKDRAEIVDDVVLQEIALGHEEALFHELGGIRGKLRLFEEGVVAHFWPGDQPGVLVSFDADSDPQPRSLLGLVRDAAYE